MAGKSPRDMSRDELMTAPRLEPAPARGADTEPPIFALAPGQVTIDQYLALREVPAHRRAARRAFAGAVRVATVESFDRLFAGVAGRG